MIVADTGPIIVFARIRRLDLLRRVVGELTIPTAAYDELVARGRWRPGADETTQGNWVHSQAICDRAPLDLFPRRLSLGEREAIVLALELQTQLLVDERPARREATARGLEVLGSLWVLAEAKRRGIVHEVGPIVQEMLRVGYRIHQDIVSAFLHDMGEGSNMPR